MRRAAPAVFLLSMLAAYYDLALSNRFDELFGVCQQDLATTELKQQQVTIYLVAVLTQGQPAARRRLHAG